MITPLIVALWGCTTPRGPEDPTSWFDAGVPQDVLETVSFTDEPYGFPTSGDGIAALYDDVFPTAEGVITFAEGDEFPSESDCADDTDGDLPMRIDGIVTIIPRYYFKTSGCDGDEKYYGSFFIEDDTGGAFVLGDSKVSHFEVGDRVQLDVRGAKTSYDLDMVYSWDLVDLQRDASPIHYDNAFGPLDFDDLYEVRRVTGTVSSAKDTFGLFELESDDGTTYPVQLDIELNRRGFDYPIGERIQVTGPVLYSYSAFSIVVMSAGQVSELDP